MWTIKQVTDLPFHATDVASHYGLPGSITVSEIRAHSISPGGEYCAGTCALMPQVSRGWVMKNTACGWSSSRLDSGAGLSAPANMAGLQHSRRE
jgi:hypothetical protein